jgi:uncharacterized protein (DUF433 family)
MNRLKQTIVEMIRAGESPEAIIAYLDQLTKELTNVNVYVKAIEERAFRP